MTQANNFIRDPLEEPRLRYGLLLIALFIALWLRFYGLGEMPSGAMHDELYNIGDGIKVSHELDFKIFHSSNQGREGFYVNQLGFVYWLFGEVHDPNHYTKYGRAVSAFWGFLGILGTYFLCLLIFREHPYKYSIAVMATLLLAGSFWHLHYSRMVYRAGLMTAIHTLTLIPLFAAFFTESDRHRRWLYIATGLLYGIGFHTYTAHHYFTLLMGVIFFYGWQKQLISMRAIIGILIIAGVVALPLYMYAVIYPDVFFFRTATNVVIETEDPIAQLIRNFDYSYRMLFYKGDMRWELLGETQITKLIQALLLLLPLPLILGLKKRSGKNDILKRFFNDAVMPVIFLLIWSFLALVPMLASNEGNLGLPHSIRSVAMTTPLHILAAFSLISMLFLLSSLFKNKLLTICLTTIIFAIGAYESATTFNDYYEWAGRFITNYKFGYDNVLFRN